MIYRERRTPALVLHWAQAVEEIALPMSASDCQGTILMLRACKLWCCSLGLFVLSIGMSYMLSPYSHASTVFCYGHTAEPEIWYCIGRAELPGKAWQLQCSRGTLPHSSRQRQCWTETDLLSGTQSLNLIRPQSYAQNKSAWKAKTVILRT